MIKGLLLLVSILGASLASPTWARANGEVADVSANNANANQPLIKERASGGSLAEPNVAWGSMSTPNDIVVRPSIREIIKSLPLMPQVQVAEVRMNPDDGTIDLVVKEVARRSYSTALTEPNQIRSLTMWNGEPVALGNDGVLREFDTSLTTMAKYKLRYVVLNGFAMGAVFVVSAKLAAGFAIPLMVIGNLGEMLSTLNHSLSLAFTLSAGAALAYPANLLARFARRTIPFDRYTGFNFFRKSIATNVREVVEEDGDMIVKFEDGSKQRLAQLFKRESHAPACAKWLKKFAG